MFLIKLWNYIRGYVIILVNGYFIERFINICTRRNILLWDLKRTGKNEARISISIGGYRKIRPIVKKAGCRTKILDKRGLPFIISRYKKRRWFVAGIVSCVLFIMIMGAFIWDISICDAEGNLLTDAAVKENILESLEEMDIKRGTIKYGVDVRLVARNLLMENDFLAWAGVRISGTRLRIELHLRDLPPVIVPENVPCDVVATADGVIESMVVKTGTALVKAGDTVKQGQILISGELRSKDETEVQYVHSVGHIYARTWYEKNAKISGSIIVKERSGKAYERMWVSFFGKKINLFLGEEILYSMYSEELIQEAHIWKMPIGIEKKKIYEIIDLEKKIDREEALKTATEQATLALEAVLPEKAEMMQRNTQVIQKEDGEYVQILIECLEDIAVQKEME